MGSRTETCQSCDYETPAHEMTTWRLRIVTRVFLPAEARATVQTGADAWLSGPFLYRNEELEQRVCVWCARRMAAGEPFGRVVRNRTKLGLVGWLAAALLGVAAFPRLQPLLTSAFWQEPDENGRRSAAYVVGPGTVDQAAARSSSTLGLPR
jgi:hypothetical protein